MSNELPEPFDYCYEWDGPFGCRKFSPSPHNDRQYARVVPLFRTEQMLAYRAEGIQSLQAQLAEARAAAIEDCAKVCEAQWQIDGQFTADDFAAAIRASGAEG